MHKFDVFLSYARRDNTAGWVTEFRKALKNVLREKRDDLRIFMDVQDIEGGQPFDDRILQSLQSSAVLIMVVSEASLDPDREWCHKEREEFIRHTKGNTDGRVYLVNYDGLDPKRLPTEISRLTPYRFFDEDDKTGHIRPALIKNGGRYHDELYSLRRDLAGALDRLIPTNASVRDQKADQSEIKLDKPEVGTGLNGPVVFLPESLHIQTAQNDYSRVEAAIAQRARVVPGRKSFFETQNGSEAELHCNFQESDLFVQLLSPQRWPLSAAYEGGYERWLLERAVEHGVPVLRWLDPDLPMDFVRKKDQEHADFLELSGKGYGRVESCQLSEFIQMIFEELAQQSLRQKYNFKDDGRPVLLVASDADQQLGDELGEQLDVLGGVESELLLCKDKESLNVFDEAIAVKPDGLVVVWDRGPRTMLSDMMKQCRRYRRSRELNPPPCAVVVPSLNSHEVIRRPPGFRVLAKDDESGLHRLVDEICAEAMA